MKIINKCPHCGIEQPVLTLCLNHSERYHTADNVPDIRTYSVICLHCGKSMKDIVIDNTLIAIKALRDEMDKLYGKPTIIPPEFWAGILSGKL